MFLSEKGWLILTLVEGIKDVMEVNGQCVQMHPSHTLGKIKQWLEVTSRDVAIPNSTKWRIGCRALNPESQKSFPHHSCRATYTTLFHSKEKPIQINQKQHSWKESRPIIYGYLNWWLEQGEGGARSIRNCYHDGRR